MNSEPENQIICSNCHAINPPNASICISCGVNLADFRAAIPRLKQLQSNKEIIQINELFLEKKDTVSIETAGGWHNLLKQIRLFIFIGIVFAVLIVIIAAIVAQNVRQRQNQLSNEYDLAVNCLETNDFLCAKNGFESLLKQEPRYPGVSDKLQESRYGLANQYSESGQWKNAIRELDLLLQDDPGNDDALTLMKDLYDRWIEDAISRGNFILSWQLRLQRDARFPSEEK